MMQTAEDRRRDQPGTAGKGKDGIHALLIAEEAADGNLL
jgi:hypothetical protein